MPRLCGRLLVTVLLVTGPLALAAESQESTPSSLPMQLASDGPRFLSTPTPADRAVVDVSSAPAFQRRVTLELDRVPLKDALTAIGRQAGLQFAGSRQLVPFDRNVSMSASNITVAGALFELLAGMGLDVQLSPDGRTAVLVPRAGTADLPDTRQQHSGAITGHVTDDVLKAPLSQVSIRIAGTSSSAVSGADGKYTIPGIAPGSYHVTARRVGYISVTKDVLLAADQKVDLDFALTAAPTRLDEVVTTAVGDQRRYQVGNVISTINVDSIAPTAPVTSVTDLISARAPGVEVMENSGLVGAGEAIRIRGVSSLVLQSDPIVIVDGIRQDNSPGGGSPVGYALGGAAYATPSRLNDINFDDIATIDVLKGPAASTEYGTDAASGVIIITTKHGSAGSPQWHADGEQTVSGLPSAYENKYYSWGHAADGSQTPVNCPLSASTAGSCVVDSVTQFNPLNDPATTLFGTGHRQKYDMSVSGGSAAVRYFLEGGLSDETGVVRMPSVFRELADTGGILLPAAALNSNVEQQRSVRLNTAIQLNAHADLSVSASYLSTYATSPDAGFLLAGVDDGLALNTAANAYGYSDQGYLGESPFNELTHIGTTNTNRMTGAATANWRPTGWFVAHATAGFDAGTDQQRSTLYPIGNNALFNSNSETLVQVGNGTNDIYTVDLRATATLPVTRGVQSVTSGGLQFVDTRGASQSGTALGVTLSNLSLNGYSDLLVQETTNNAATLGGYGEEQIGIDDRLFLIGALRIDAASGFGSQYAVAAYPKASASWLAVNGAKTTVRLRAAFGEAGAQPQNGASQLLYSASNGYSGGAVVPGEVIAWPGNPDLRPERSEEYEGGVDLGGWGNRLSVELTAYRKVTHDALINASLAGDLSGSYEENVGQIDNGGAEATATVGLIQSRSVMWEITINASVNSNKLVSLAPGAVLAGGSGNQLNKVGYPLYGLWGAATTYADANHDGIIEAGEASISDSLRFLGPAAPTREASFATHLGLWHGMVTLGGLVDYRGGYKIDNEVALEEAYVKASAGANLATAPLWEQAGVANPFNSNYVSSASFFEDGTFIRLRELSVTYAIPASVIRRIGVVENLSLTGAVRNLALWTRYTGIDPEVSNAGFNGYNISYEGPGGYNGYSSINNDIRVDLGAVPLLRDWVVRLNVGLK